MEITASSFKLRANAPEGRKRFPISKFCKRLHCRTYGEINMKHSFI